MKAQADKGHMYCCAKQAGKCTGQRIFKNAHSVSRVDSAARENLLKLQLFSEAAINRLPREQQWVCNACQQAMIRRLAPAGTPLWLSEMSARWCHDLMCIVCVCWGCAVPVAGPMTPSVLFAKAQPAAAAGAAAAAAAAPTPAGSLPRLSQGDLAVAVMTGGVTSSSSSSSAAAGAAEHVLCQHMTGWGSGVGSV